MWVIKEPCWASELHLFEFQSSRWPDVRRSCSHSYAVRNISQGVVSSLKVLISLQSLTICSHSFVKDSVRCLSIPRWNCISAIPILSFLLSPGSLRGCNLCEQLLLLVPWLRPPGGHPHPAQHSVWELVRKVQETHHPERIWSRCGGRTSQCEDSHTHTFNYLTLVHQQLYLYLYFFRCILRLWWMSERLWLQHIFPETC